MKIFLDTADIDEIKKAHETGMIEGITTNPTLIKKSGRDPVEVIKEIAAISNHFESVSAEVVVVNLFELKLPFFFEIFRNIFICYLLLHFLCINLHNFLAKILD